VPAILEENESPVAEEIGASFKKLFAIRLEKGRIVAAP